MVKQCRYQFPFFTTNQISFGHSNKWSNQKNIFFGVKITRNQNYESEDEDAVSDGGDAQLAWFKCTDLETKPEDKENYKKELIKYCSKDTEAMYDLINYFLKLKTSKRLQ